MQQNPIPSPWVGGYSVYIDNLLKKTEYLFENNILSKEQKTSVKNEIHETENIYSPQNYPKRADAPTDTIATLLNKIAGEAIGMNNTTEEIGNDAKKQRQKD